MTDEKKRVIFLGETHEGKKHDKRALEDDGLIDALPEGGICWSDKGFQGLERGRDHLLIMYPEKKPRGGELSRWQKTYNRYVNSKRILVEHAIGGVKRYGIVREVFRNRRRWMEDKVMEVACGLWNFHIRMEEMKVAA